MTKEEIERAHMPEPRIGTDASSGRRWSPPSPDAQALQASIDAAIARGDPSVSLRPDETYYFNSASLNVSSSKGFRLEGNGAKVILALGSSVRVTNARATTIANVVIDYNEEPASQATILFANRGCFSAKAEAVVEASTLNDRVCELLVEVMPNFPPPDPSVRPDLCFWPACETKLILFEGNRTYRVSSPPRWSHGLPIRRRCAAASSPCVRSRSGDTLCAPATWSQSLVAGVVRAPIS